MGLAQVFTRAGVGVQAPEVTVEVYTGGGLPKISMVGLAEVAVKEARDRVRAALMNAHFRVHSGAVTISLAPADLRKRSGRFDLPIAIGMLAASSQIRSNRLADTEFIGELSLAGSVRPVRGILPVVLQSQKAGRQLIIPSGNADEAGLAGPPAPLCADNLLEVVAWLNGTKTLPEATEADQSTGLFEKDLSEVIGQEHARRALEIAAAGQHNLLFRGPPGTGKTMLSSRLPGILPPMSIDEALEAAAVDSISLAGLDVNRWRERRFRAPHHTASAIALVGGGSQPRPGEISRAHNGVLFLDELPEFGRHVLEVLREPIESGRIIICRASGEAEFPARFQLIAAMNPCPCGFHGDRQKTCICSAEQVERYLGKISGPMLDRIDLFVDVTRPKHVIIPGKGKVGDSSATVRTRVVAAHRIQIERQGLSNGGLETSGVKEFCRLNADDESFFESAAERLHLSPRGCQRVLKVARTIADLDRADEIRQAHLAEAIGLRQPGRR